jgi:hypothetical protein
MKALCVPAATGVTIDDADEPLAVVGHVDLGVVNRYIHIWAYTSLDQREKVQATARQTGVWPQGGGAGRLLTMKNKVMMPAAFSPMQQ